MPTAVSASQAARASGSGGRGRCRAGRRCRLPCGEPYAEVADEFGAGAQDVRAGSVLLAGRRGEFRPSLCPVRLGEHRVRRLAGRPGPFRAPLPCRPAPELRARPDHGAGGRPYVLRGQWAGRAAGPPQRGQPFGPGVVGGRPAQPPDGLVTGLHPGDGPREPLTIAPATGPGSVPVPVPYGPGEPFEETGAEGGEADVGRRLGQAALHVGPGLCQAPGRVGLRGPVPAAAALLPEGQVAEVGVDALEQSAGGSRVGSPGRVQPGFAAGLVQGHQVGQGAEFAVLELVQQGQRQPLRVGRPGGEHGAEGVPGGRGGHAARRGGQGHDAVQSGREFLGPARMVVDQQFPCLPQEVLPGRGAGAGRLQCGQFRRGGLQRQPEGQPPVPGVEHGDGLPAVPRAGRVARQDAFPGGGQDADPAASGRGARGPFGTGGRLDDDQGLGHLAEPRDRTEAGQAQPSLAHRHRDPGRTGRADRREDREGGEVPAGATAPVVRRAVAEGPGGPGAEGGAVDHRPGRLWVDAFDTGQQVRGRFDGPAARSVQRPAQQQEVAAAPGAAQQEHRGPAARPGGQRVEDVVRQHVRPDHVGAAVGASRRLMCPMSRSRSVQYTVGAR
ncbi:hypothetical protein OJ963_05820 [Streptomyces sp. RS2]|nr:hypothetical protein [Streptomyces sp. RS2]MCW1093519.1 hypothetical protein [Streptomyces sp. RS2]